MTEQSERTDIPQRQERDHSAWDRFTETFAATPDGQWAAPGRVNLIGEHTDYNEGFVLPFALPHRIVVTARKLDTPQWTVQSESENDTRTFTAADLTPGAVTGWASYVAGVVWALTDAGHDIPGAELSIASTVPVGSGLSSSAALECALVSAFADLAQLDTGQLETGEHQKGQHQIGEHQVSPVSIDPLTRALIARRAENVYVGAPTGLLDQAASTLCRARHALFLDCRTTETAQIPLDLPAAELAILVIDTNTRHAHVDGEYAVRRRSCEQAAAILGVPALRDISVAALDDAMARIDDEIVRKRARHVITENQRVLDTVETLRGGEIRDIGDLLTASHASMRDDFENSVPEVDTAVDAALKAGAYGARMTGGGFGGCVIALIDRDSAGLVTAAVAAAFARAGFTQPSAFTAVPSAGAGRAES